MKILFKNARILTMKDENIIEGNLVVKDNRIAYIGNDYQKYGPFEREIDCHKNLLMPGFKNAHAHSAMVFLRGKADDVPLQEWLFDVVFPHEANLQPTDIYYLNKVAYLEYLTSGITAVFDHYFYPTEMARASEEFGMRSLLLVMPDEEKYPMDYIFDTYHKFNDRKESLVRIRIGFHAEYTSDDACFDRAKATIEHLKSPFFTHISETEKEVKECVERHHMTPAKYIYEKGLFKYGGGAYHCVHFTDEEAKIFKDNGLYIVTCPCSNAKLASGVAPLMKYYEMGLNIAMGTDGPASNNGLDMFKEMYLAASLNKLECKDARAIPAFEFLKMATVNSAKAMGLDDADVLEEGKLADIIMIDLSQPNMQPLNNIVTNLVYSGNKQNVVLTMIDGKILYENGKFFLKENLEDIYRNAEIVTARLESDTKNKK